MANEAERVDAYLNTINRFEPDIAATDQAASGSSIAISLKRIADSLEKLAGDQAVNRYGENLADAIQNSIVRGLRGINTHD